MFDFFQNIFSKVISLMASVIIAVGLVSVPEVPEQLLPIEQPKEEVVIEEIDNQEIKRNEEAITAEANITNENEKDADSLENKTENREKNNTTVSGEENNTVEKQEDILKDMEKLREELQEKYSQQQIEEREYQPRLIYFEDSLGNIYREDKDYTRIGREPFDNGFGNSRAPFCLNDVGEKENCELQIVEWIKNRSIHIGEVLNITLNSFDKNGDDVLYKISYGAKKDFGYENIKELQQWSTKNDAEIPITEGLYNRGWEERTIGFGMTTFNEVSERYGHTSITLSNAGTLNLRVCFNDKAEKMKYPLGEQFTNGCVWFEYFIVKPGISTLTVEPRAG